MNGRPPVGSRCVFPQASDLISELTPGNLTRPSTILEVGTTGILGSLLDVDAQTTLDRLGGGSESLPLRLVDGEGFSWESISRLVQVSCLP